MAYKGIVYLVKTGTNAAPETRLVEIYLGNISSGDATLQREFSPARDTIWFQLSLNRFLNTGGQGYTQEDRAIRCRDLATRSQEPTH